MDEVFEIFQDIFVLHVANLKDIRGSIMKQVLFCIAIVILSCLPLLSTAATIDVNTTADELNTDGDCSLREAITAANTNTSVDACNGDSLADTINIPAGTYILTISGVGEDLAATGDLDITDSQLTINGAGATSTIIDGDGLDRVIHILTGSAQPVVINNITVRNGNLLAGSSGGGISSSGSLTLNNCVVSGNNAEGGVGGITITGGGTLNLNNSTISGNTASGGNGGGIFVLSTLICTNSTIDGNNASASGGGIANLGGDITLDKCTVSNNTAVGGSGIWNNSTIDITNSTISANTSPGAGSGIYNEGTMTIENSTISGNTATNFASGIFNFNGTLSFRNTIVANNT
jgi:CSLREA domain-containing protein